jgi:hypothetical protein
MSPLNVYRDETKPGERHVYTADSPVRPGAPVNPLTPDASFVFNADPEGYLVLHVGPLSLELVAEKAPLLLERYRREFGGKSGKPAGLGEILDGLLGGLPQPKPCGHRAGKVVDMGTAFPPDTWAVVELMGHVRVAGRLSEIGFGGVTLGLLHIPYQGEFRMMSFHPNSIYRLQIVNEAAARTVAALEEENYANWPVKPWEMPKAEKVPAQTTDPVGDALDGDDFVASEGETD